MPSTRASPAVCGRGAGIEGFVRWRERAALEVDDALPTGEHTEPARRREPNDASLAQLDGRELAGAGNDLGRTPAGNATIGHCIGPGTQRHDGDDRGRRRDCPWGPACGDRRTRESSPRRHSSHNLVGGRVSDSRGVAERPAASSRRTVSRYCRSCSPDARRQAVSCGWLGLAGFTASGAVDQFVHSGLSIGTTAIPRLRRFAASLGMTSCFGSSPRFPVPCSLFPVPYFSGNREVTVPAASRNSRLGVPNESTIRRRRGFPLRSERLTIADFVTSRPT